MALSSKFVFRLAWGVAIPFARRVLSSLQRHQCPFDQCTINIPLDKLPINSALILLIGSGGAAGEVKRHEVEPDSISSDRENDEAPPQYKVSMHHMKMLAVLLRPSNNQQLSRPMQRKLVTLINCQPMEEDGRARALRSARSLGERSVTELILQHQNPQQLSANLWAAVRTRGCQFLGPAMQEEVLKLVLLALEDGSALSRKVLVMFVVQRLEHQFPQASKTSVGHVVQLLYRASCFKVTKREGDSSLMQLKEEFRTYEMLRREHDAQIVQIATEAGLRIAPDQWSSLLYGDTTHKSHMQSIIDKLQTPQSFVQSVQELVIALQRTGDPGNLTSLRSHLDLLSVLDPSPDSSTSDWDVLNKALMASEKVVVGLLSYMANHGSRRSTGGSGNHSGSRAVGPDAAAANSAVSRYKTSMCRDLAVHGSCPRGKNCTFAHSANELDQHRNKTQRSAKKADPLQKHPDPSRGPGLGFKLQQQEHRPASRVPPLMSASHCVPPVAQVAPVPRGPDRQQQHILPVVGYANPHYRQETSRMAPPMPIPGLLAQQAPSANVLIHPHHQLQGFSSIVQLADAQQPFGGPGDQSYQSHLYFHTVEDVHLPPDLLDRDDWKMPGRGKQVATKSLSALKSRKEEIIGSLQGMIGEEETKKISVRTAERASTLQKVSIRAPETPSPSGGGGGNENYCLWTSRVFTPLVQDQDGGDGEAPECGQAPESPSEDVIPFGDTPQISRFGPISRRSDRASVLQSFKTSQTQATMDDEPQPTPVVTNSKQMSRPAPPIPPAFLHQNGALTQLQPVAVGMNGEIGFIAVQSPEAQSNMELRHLHNNFLQGQCQQQHAAPDHHLPAESEKMKHELEILQQKISCLNLARMPAAASAAAASSNEVKGDEKREREGSGQKDQEKAQLTNELQLIENTILDREREISINHRGGDSNALAPLDHGMMLDGGGERGASAGITTIARSGQIPRTNGRFFEPF